MNEQYLTPAQLAARWGQTKKALANRRDRKQAPPFIKLGTAMSSPVRYPIEGVLAVEQQRSASNG